MNIETFLEYILITKNAYGKVGCSFIKEEYWTIEYNYNTIVGYITLAVDNKCKKFEIDNWKKLEKSTLIDIFIKNDFITIVN